MPGAGSKIDLSMTGEKTQEDAQQRLMMELHSLRQENARLKKLLHQHGVDWRVAPRPVPRSDSDAPPSAEEHLSPDEKIAIFRRLFRGRTDCYPLRWESSKGTSGYSPACGNEWRPGVCGKPKVKCGSCEHRDLLPVDYQVIYGHLAGKHTAGVYPLLDDNTCLFLAADFDDAGWREDAVAFIRSCREMDITAALEISRSGSGAHVWIFCSEPVPAREARLLGAALISHTCERTRQLSLSSYDRFFPNQDTLPKGGFGNLIALPLQKAPRRLDRSVFVDENYSPYADQWAFLAKIRPMSKTDLEDALLRTSGGRHPLDVAFTSVEEDQEPWRPASSIPSRCSSAAPVRKIGSARASRSTRRATSAT